MFASTGMLKVKWVGTYWHHLWAIISYSSLPCVGTTVQGLGRRRIVEGGNERRVLKEKLFSIFLGTCFPHVIFSTLTISEFQRSGKKSHVSFILIPQILNLPYLLYPFPSKYIFFSEPFDSKLQICCPFPPNTECLSFSLPSLPSFLLLSFLWSLAFICIFKNWRTSLNFFCIYSFSLKLRSKARGELPDWMTLMHSICWRSSLPLVRELDEASLHINKQFKEWQESCLSDGISLRQLF